MALGTWRARRSRGAGGDARARGDDPVLRYLATRELAALVPGPGAQFRLALRAALEDKDSRVRETAALRWASRARNTERALALIAGASRSRGPCAPRRGGGARPYPRSPRAADLMLRAIGKDVDEVRRAALVGLVRCKDQRARTVLLKKSCSSRRKAATVRELAAALIVNRGTRARRRSWSPRCAGWSTRR